MEKAKAYELLATVEEAGKQGRVHELANHEHVVILKKRHWHLWSVEDWHKFLESEGNKVQATDWTPSEQVPAL